MNLQSTSVDPSPQTGCHCHFRDRRSLHCERGSLARADGSAHWTQESTSVIAAVYGPRETLARKEDPEKAMVEVVLQPKSGLSGEKILRVLDRSSYHSVSASV